MTHAELVERAERWLRKTRGCGVVLTEFTAHHGEEPDAIGWANNGFQSILVECKASRNDFRADQQKPSRRRHTGPSAAVVAGFRLGKERWYMTPPGLIRPDEVPEEWGLLEVGERQVRTVVKAVQSPPGLYHQITANEVPFLYSALRRHHCRACFKDINTRRQLQRRRQHRCPSCRKILPWAFADPAPHPTAATALASHEQRDDETQGEGAA